MDGYNYSAVSTKGSTPSPSWKAVRTGAAGDKLKVFIPALVVVVVAVMLFLWLSGELGGSAPLDPDGIGPPSPPFSPALYNHSVGPLEPSIPFLYTLTLPPLTYALVSPTAEYVYTVHASTNTIALWGMDHLFIQQSLLDPATATLPFGTVGYAYIAQGFDNMLVTFPGNRASVVLYAIDPDSGELTFADSCTTPGVGPIIALADDSGTTNIVGTDGLTNLYFFDINDGYLNCTGAGTGVITAPSDVLALAVEPTNVWLYTVHLTSIIAWNWLNTTVFSTVVSGATQFAPQVVMVDSTTLCVMDIGLQQLLFYTINSTDGTLALLTTLSIGGGGLSFGATPHFAYVLTASSIKQWVWVTGAAMVPASVASLATSSALIVVYPSYDAVSVYQLGAKLMYQWVIM